MPGRASYSIQFPKPATAAAVAQSSPGSPFTAADGGLEPSDFSRMGPKFAKLPGVVKYFV